MGPRYLKSRALLRTFFLVIIIGFFFLTSYLFCQENSNNQKQDLSRTEKPVIVDADDVEYTEEGAKIIGKGNVKVTYEGMKLTAEKIEVDINTKEAVASRDVHLYYKDIEMIGERLIYDFQTRKGYFEDPKNVGKINKQKKIKIIQNDMVMNCEHIDFDLKKEEAFASGDVELLQDGSRLTGKNLIYNFNTEEGHLTDVEVQDVLWYGKAEEADKFNKKKKVDLKRAYMTSCDREKPHYRIQGKTVHYYIDDKIVAKNVLVFIGNIPVMYLPYWRQSLHNTTNLTVVAGHKKDWGYFALTSSEYYLDKNLKTILHLDHRELKGFASGVDADYNLPDYGEGQIKTYYMNERDKYLNGFNKSERDDYIAENGLEKYNEEIQERERYRGQVKHRWQMDDSSLVLMQYNKSSDIDFMKDYFYREYEEDVQPISDAALSHAADDYNCSIYARKRTNRFYSEVERLPELSFNLNSQDLGETDLYYRNELALVNLNKKTANSVEDADVNRFDTYNELKYLTQLPYMFDWINFAPYVGTRQTYYSKDSLGEDEDMIRGSLHTGFDLNTTFYRTSNFSDDICGIEINRLRHIVNPSIKYTYIHRPTILPNKLGAFDSVDALDRTDFFTYGLENHLQTKWKKPNSDELETVELIYFYPHVDFYTKVGPGERHFGLFEADLDVRPYRWLTVNSDSVYNQYQRRVETANIDLWATGEKDKWSLGLGKRYERDDSKQLTTDFYYEINRFWQIRAYTRYEGYTDYFEEQQYTIYRDLHCWLLEISYNLKLNQDRSTRDMAFWLIFRLKAAPEETPIRYKMGRERINRL